MLPKARIQELASAPEVRTIAVQNFLGSLAWESSHLGNLLNLSTDAKIYGWNEPTVEAIRVGVEELHQLQVVTQWVYDLFGLDEVSADSTARIQAHRRLQDFLKAEAETCSHLLLLESQRRNSPRWSEPQSQEPPASDDED